MINENQGTTVESENNGTGVEANEEVVTLKKADYELLNQTLGSLKRENKDLKKSKVTSPETSERPNSDEVSSLKETLNKQILKSASISHEDDIALAKTTAQKWGMTLDQVVEDEDFLTKLEKVRTTRSNLEATTGIKGDKSTGSQAKNNADYWLAKGVPPSRTDVPDDKTRRKIVSAFVAREKQGGASSPFYNG